MSRQEDLEQSIRESYRVIREYEAIIRTSDRPEEKLRAERVVREQKELIARYLAEYRSLSGNDLPEELAQIEVLISTAGDEDSLRDRELAYLGRLLDRYAFWRDHYTPLAGIAEVRAAVVDGPRLDLPMPFIPRGFDKLVEHGFGARQEIRREPIDDLSTALAEHRRIVLLGDPGSGKTTTLWRLVYDYALAARKDEAAPLPVLVPLGGYTDDSPFDAYLASHLGPLSAHLSAYRALGRLILLLDGLNEMPQAGYAERVVRIRDALAGCPDEMVVVTCRALDYAAKLEEMTRVEVSPLDNDRIRVFLHDYLGETAGKQLFWQLCGGEEVRELWEIWQGAGRTWVEFWSAERVALDVFILLTSAQRDLHIRLCREPPPLLSLVGNPYILLMTAQVYANVGGELPTNRGRMLAAFVATLLDREKRKTEEEWIEAETQQDGLAALAYAMQIEGGQGTTVSREWALERLCQAVPDCGPARLLYLATSATLLETGDGTVRFYHQLLQEYFAALGLRERVEQGKDLAGYWPSRWWEPSGWEETFISLAGMEEDASALLMKLAEANPVVAARCIFKGGAQVDETAQCTVIAALEPTLSDDGLPATVRARAGDSLARLGDPRPGVGLRPDGLPDITWCEVPDGPFLMGSSAAVEMANDDEMPQYTVKLPAFRIAKYPITNAQYAAFVEDGGYTEKWRACWTDVGWQWKGDRVGPRIYGGAFDLPNHPIVGVTWYEAVAFCRWLTARLQRPGDIKADEEIALPTEAQWEKAARGMDGRIYPWGDEIDPNRANTRETGTGTTSAVGCFPGGVSPYGALDMSGNVWEWCRTELQASYENYREADDLAGNAPRVFRGGSWSDLRVFARCTYRFRDYPGSEWDDYGFRCVVSPISPPLASGSRHSVLWTSVALKARTRARA